MRVHSLGRLNVPTPGTPVPLTTDRSIRCAWIRAQVIAGLTGKAFLGTPDLNTATLAGVIKEFWPNPSGGISDSLEIRSAEDNNIYTLADLAIDAAVAGEGLVISYGEA
jgi:hypothetical protein